ncbi:MAG: type II toxin-antitoxin system RelE/ParE family toxin [Deltaproteobacteria bacterium]|nr:type II toxin-antitoxin system RelE/ParE family toxin [Deltaproteobacteria bacterium]
MTCDISTPWSCDSIGRQRVFYVVVVGPVAVLLHAYNKQSQRAPGREIETAERRMSDVLGR